MNNYPDIALVTRRLRRENKPVNDSPECTNITVLCKGLNRISTSSPQRERLFHLLPPLLLLDPTQALNYIHLLMAQLQYFQGYL